MCCIDRYGFVPLADMAPTGRSTAYDYYSSPPKCNTMLTLSGRSPPGPRPGREEVINHKISIIKGTKVDLAVRQVGRRGVRVLGVTGGFCGDKAPPLFYFSQVVYYSGLTVRMSTKLRLLYAADRLQWRQNTIYTTNSNKAITYQP